jgi:hypothetical protein
MVVHARQIRLTVLSQRAVDQPWQCLLKEHRIALLVLFTEVGTKYNSCVGLNIHRYQDYNVSFWSVINHKILKSRQSSLLEGGCPSVGGWGV